MVEYLRVFCRVGFIFFLAQATSEEASAAGKEGNVDANSEKSVAELQLALAYANNVIDTLREPFVVLDKKLWVRTVNASYCRAFHVSKADTENHSFFELGNAQWDNAEVRMLLRDATNDHQPDALEFEREFPALGKRSMKLRARRIVSPLQEANSELTLLAIEDVTDSRQMKVDAPQEEAAWRKSEVQYRRLFESARDGILILDERTGKIIDANPFMRELLGFDLAYFLGKELWEIGVFADIAANQAAIRSLQADGYIRYDHLPLETRDKRRVEVEVVANAYEAGGQIVIQCNIRDCSERFRLERELRASLQEKEVLLKEIHHRVKNNLQVISSLLHLQSRHTRDPASATMFAETQNRVRSMALVHERLYRSKDLARVDFTEYIEGLATHLFSAHQVDSERVQLAVDVQGVMLPIDAAIPCGLLLNELISNCLKHAFQGRARGEIRIGLAPQKEGEFLLTVTDDGVGMPPEVEPHSAESFGMQLIADLVDQLHGKVQIIRDAGTTVRITFPGVPAKPAQSKDQP